MLASIAFLHIGPAAAELKLLPPEDAFRYSARAIDARTLEAQFTIADGYYLYRDKLRFGVEPAPAAAGVPALPPGKMKDDAFFGRVETYRDRVVVRIPVEQAAPGQSVTLRAESQGCADAGVCYPPSLQRITIAIPPAGGAPGPFVEAAPTKKRWFQ
ncbi:MAG TPA: protein-disulfide reductase DsbD N-terminal domain-containing protein [Casimicrobiaceae bacterium]|nr:protein-disulfide reductase DsbD N-terminal domain-containing protein [Casimicrobiaceae bacterium]